MLKYIFPLALFTAAEETQAAGGAAPVAPAAPAAPAQAAAPVEPAQAAAPAAPAEKPLGIIEQAMAGIRTKATLNKEISQVKGEKAILEGQVSTLTARNAELEKQVAEFQADHLKLEQAVKEAAEEKQTVDTAAAAKLASAGVPAQALPVAGADAQETADGLRDKLKTTTDPKERFRLQERIDSLESATA